MSDPGSEFATEPVPEDRTVSWVRVSLVAAMVAFSLPTFLTGIEVASAVDPTTALAAIIIGDILLTVIGALTASIGARTRLSSYMLTRIAFGTRGASLVNLAFAISLLGWFGVNIDLFGGAVLRLSEDVFGWQPPVWAVELVAGFVMTVTTAYGFRAINFLSALLVPVLMVVTVLLIQQSLAAPSAAVPVAAATPSVLSFGDAVSAVVGAIIIGAVILPDITRFIRNWRGGIYTAVMAYLVICTVVQFAGALAATTFGNDDLLDVMIVIGLGWAAFAIVIAGSWILNSLNLYSTILSVEATLPRLSNRLAIPVLGALGTLAAFLNILDTFLTFLFYLAIVFAPVAGVIIVDYLWMRRSAYHEQREVRERGLRPSALAAWSVGALVALLGANEVLTVSGIAALDAILIAAGSYLLFTRIGSDRLTPGGPEVEPPEETRT